MKNIDWKKLLPFGIAIIAFIAFAMLYCLPVLQGKVLHAGDVLNWQGAAHESQEFQKENGYNTTNACTRWFQWRLDRYWYDFWILIRFLPHVTLLRC